MDHRLSQAEKCSTCSTHSSRPEACSAARQGAHSRPRWSRSPRRWAPAARRAGRPAPRAQWASCRSASTPGARPHPPPGTRASPPAAPAARLSPLPGARDVPRQRPVITPRPAGRTACQGRPPASHPPPNTKQSTAHSSKLITDTTLLGCQSYLLSHASPYFQRKIAI